METGTETAASGGEVGGEVGQSTNSAPPPTKKKWLLKDGDYSEEIDSEDELIRRATHATAAQRRFDQAAKMRKEIQEEREALRRKDNPNRMAMLKKMIGSDEDLEELASSFLLERIKYNSLSDTEKENLNLKRQLDETGKEKKEREEREKKYRLDQLNAKAAQEIDAEIGEALKSFSSKPTPRLVMRIAEDMIAALNRKGGALKASDAIANVSKGLEADLLEYLENAPEEKVLALLPKRVRELLRKSNLAEVQSPFATRSRSEPRDERPPQRPKKMKTDDFFKNMEKKWR